MSYQLTLIKYYLDLWLFRTEQNSLWQVKYSLCYFTKSWLIAWNCITKSLAPFVFRLRHKRFEATKQQNVPKERHDINDFQNGQSLGTEDDRPPPPLDNIEPLSQDVDVNCLIIVFDNVLAQQYFTTLCHSTFTTDRLQDIARHMIWSLPPEHVCVKNNDFKIYVF